MKKRILSLLMTLCVAVCFVPTLAFADETPTQTVVKIDVGGEPTKTDDYEITSSMIKILKPDQVYELTGTTNKEIRFWGSADLNARKNFYLKLDNVTTGAIGAYSNPDGMMLNIEVPDGTTNSTGVLYAVDLTITGKGTLNTTDIGVTQSTKVKNQLHITDTTIVTKVARNSAGWEGECVLDGSANVKFIGNGDYPPLKLGQKSGTHSLTLKDNAKLYCLQDDTKSLTGFSVDGMQTFNGASITLKDNAYLETQGRDSTSEWKGTGLVCNGNLAVQGNATIKATGYSLGIDCGGKISVNGGKFIAKGVNSNGVYAGNGIEIKNAEAEVEGYYPALFGASGVSVENSTVTAKANDVAIYSPDKVAITNSIIKATSPDGCDGIRGNNGTNVSGSWIKTSGDETFADDPDSITDSVLFNGKTGKTIGNHQIPGDVTVEKDMTLDIAKDTSITVPDKKTFTNHGKIDVKGTFTKEDGGTVICDSHSGGTATCVKKATCDVCKAEYGDIDASNHESLKHVEAKAATKDQEGNIEYWYCEDCGKYFADKAGEKEIAQADTVIAKLPADPAADQNEGTKKNDSSASTGDDSNLVLWVALILLSGCAAGGTVLYRRTQH